LDLFPGLPKTEARESLPGPKGLQDLLKGTISVGFETSQKMGQSLTDLSDLGSGFRKGEGQREANLIGESLCPS
jgi:hypothetical protein